MSEGEEAMKILQKLKAPFNKEFLIKVSETPEGATDMKITITQGEGDPVPTIGKYNFMEVAIMFQEMVGPFFTE